jgi:prepilin-type N-terminal cleavage/methylation domain-containing protein
MISRKLAGDRSGSRALIRQRGNTLLELLIALAILLTISAAAFGLFNSMQLANTNLQAQQGLSMALRSAESQLQLDLANAGNGYFQGVNVPSWPVGVTIVNNWVAPGSSCYVNGSYTFKCFDQLNIVAADPIRYPAVNPTDISGDANPASCPATYTTGSGTTIVYALPASGLSLPQTQANFSVGDQLLFLHSTTTGTLLTTSTVTNVGLNSANTAVALTINQTLANGSNTMTNDPLDITACDGNACPPAGSPNYFGTNFCGTSDWIVKLTPIEYYVQSTGNSNNPWQLVRQQNGVVTDVMDQIIGFKVGASVWNAVDTGSGFSTNAPYYNYQASTYQLGGSGIAEAWNFSLVRSVRISMIARSAPSTASVPGTYHNAFDQGPYQVRGAAIIVSPRNLSMNDNQNQALQ